MSQVNSFEDYSPLADSMETFSQLDNIGGFFSLYFRIKNIHRCTIISIIALYITL